LLAVIESAQGPPRVQFDFVTKTRGLDYVAEVRGAAREVNGERAGGQPSKDRGWIA
jgi:hypothetical protein